VAAPSHNDAASENARLAALRSFSVIDTPPEKEFDEIVRLAAGECNTPVAIITLVDDRRCWSKAKLGLDVTQVPRNLAFCDYAYRSSSIFVVPDARVDARFNQLPVVAELGYCYYAGVPLVTSDGHSIGVLCVLDRQPRELSSDQMSALRKLGVQTMSLLEQRRSKTSAPTGESQAPFAQAGLSGDARHLLIVDDDDAVRAFVCVATRRLGYAVLEASHGVDALTQMEKNPGKIGLVLTDINMPVMDGLELIRALKKLTPPPAIAVMSGRFETYVRSSLLAEGVTSLLGKPFSRDELKLTLLNAKPPVAK